MILRDEYDKKSQTPEDRLALSRQEGLSATGLAVKVVGE